MNKEPTTRLPLIVKIAVALTFFNSWVLFEETIVDRYGLWRYMPFYKVGFFCVWDVAALLIIIPACGTHFADGGSARQGLGTQQTAS